MGVTVLILFIAIFVIFIVFRSTNMEDMDTCPKGDTGMQGDTGFLGDSGTIYERDIKDEK